MHPVAGPILQRLGGEVRAQAVARGDGVNDCPEGHGVVRRRQGIRVAEVYLVLTRPLLMVGAFRQDSHLLQSQADFPAHVFPLVLRSNVHISGIVIGNLCCFAGFIQPEQIEFHLRAEGEADALFFGFRKDFTEKRSGVRFHHPAVRIRNGTEHAHDLPMFRPPRKKRQSGGIRMEQKIGMYFPAEARDGGGVYGNAVCKRALQLPGGNGNILLLAVNVAEGETDEFYILLRDILHDLTLRVFHNLFRLPNLLHTFAGTDSYCPA